MQPKARLSSHRQPNCRSARGVFHELQRISCGLSTQHYDTLRTIPVTGGSDNFIKHLMAFSRNVWEGLNIITTKRAQDWIGVVSFPPSACA